MKTQTFVRKFLFILPASLVVTISIGFAIHDYNTNRYLGGDWYLIQAPIAAGIDYGQAMFNPPWIAVLLYPIAKLPHYVGHGLLSGLSLVVFSLILYLIDPNRPLVFGLTLLSYPIIRLMFEGNIEILTVAGVYLIYLAQTREKEAPLLYAIGVFLSTAKLQETLLILAASSLYLLLHHRWRTLLLSGLYLLLPIGLTMLWKGQEWLTNLPSNYELYSLNRLVDGPVYYALAVVLAIAALVLVNYRQSLLPSIGLLTATSILIAPYAGYVSLTLVVIYATYYQLTQGIHILGFLSLVSFYAAFFFLHYLQNYAQVILILHVIALMGLALADMYRQGRRPFAVEPGTPEGDLG